MIIIIDTDIIQHYVVTNSKAAINSRYKNALVVAAGGGLSMITRKHINRFF